MKQYKLFVLLIQALCFLVIPASGGFDRIPQPTPVFSRGVSGVSLLDPKSLWINPASNGTNTHFQGSFFYSPSPFQLSQLSNTGVVVSDQIYSVGVGAGIHTFGFSLYRENVLTISAAKDIMENVYLGIGIHSYHISISQYGDDFTVGFDLGLLSQLTDHLSIGLSLQNLNAPQIADEENSIPQTMISGISYLFDKNTVVTIDVVKDIEFPLTYRIGFQIQPVDAVIVQGGILEETSRLYGGLGIQLNDIQLDYGFSSHPELGLTHSIGITLFP